MSVKEANTSITLSAIIPVGGFPNGDSVLRSWVLKQLPRGLEVILILDSDDESVRTSVQEIATSDPKKNVSVLISHYRNPGSTREIGLKAAKGKWICFWDADDLPQVSNVWRNLDSKESQEADIIVGNYRSVDFESKNELEHPHGTSNPLMNVYLNPGLWRCVFKGKLLENVSFPALRMGEDQIFLFRSINKSTNIKFAEDNFYDYYQYPTGQLTKSNDISTDLVKARNLCKEIYSAHQNNYLLAAILRQNLTLIKRGSPSIKFITIIDLLSLSARSLNNLKTLFRVLTMVQNGI
jgi:glycosyltransferase involved in cell wall biosynthesis